MSNPYLYDVAKKLSLTSPYGRFKVGALFAKKNKIISLGVNQKKTHPLQKTFTKTPNLVPWLHAEIHGITLACEADLRGADVYVARSLANGLHGTSKPCEGCLRALKHYGIRNMYYFDGHNVQCEDVI